LDLTVINYPVPSDQLWSQSLHTNKGYSIGLGSSGFEEKTAEDYIVSGLIDFDDISYDENADLLYELAGQVVAHLRSYLDEESAKRVLKFHQSEIVRLVYAQMQQHTWEEDCEYEVIVSQGFVKLKEGSFKSYDKDEILNYRTEPKDKSNMPRYLFGSFAKCLYPVQRFHSDTERRLAVILERDSLKWFRPVAGQFQITYKWGHEQSEYQPDFVAEGETTIYMLEPKMKKEMEDRQVAAKATAAIEWCKHASDHAATYNGKPWKYVLIPHDAIADNMSLEGLAERYGKTA
jgi:type III restriction enzyme